MNQTKDFLNMRDIVIDPFVTSHDAERILYSNGERYDNNCAEVAPSDQSTETWLEDQLFERRRYA